MSDVRTRTRQPSYAGREPVRPFWDGISRGSEVVALCVALTLTAATAEITASGHLRVFFDLCFIAVCVAAALLVRPGDFFTIGVLPPLLMFGTMVLVALNGPAVVANPHDSIVQAVVTGLAHHSLALFVGYAVCLATLVLRNRGA